ncbi:MAG TPA: addiction module protein [Thermoanaerobaculia bacterium]|jgi:putative addiction module component (TIGR02574 family)
MSARVQAVWNQVSELSADERSELLDLLIADLEPPADPGAAEAWDQEIERRVAELRSGAVQTVPWETVRASLLDPARRPKN